MQKLCQQVYRRCFIQGPLVRRKHHPELLQPVEVRAQDGEFLEKFLKLGASSQVSELLPVSSQLRQPRLVPSKATHSVYCDLVNYFKQGNSDQNKDDFKNMLFEAVSLWLCAVYSGRLLQYFHTEKEKYPLYVLKHDKLLYDVNLETTPAIPILEASDDASRSSVQTLDEAVATFKQESDECCGALLNKCAMEYRKRNDYETAFKLFQSAANHGHVPSLYNVGLCYEFGHGVETSLVNAEKCYTEAADKGHVKSMFNIATFHYERDGRLSGDHNKVGFYYMKKAADQGLVQACSFVALKYTEDENWSEAFRYFRMAADQKDRSSLFNIAVCHENGLGTRKDVPQAMMYYCKAAAMGDDYSQFLLGDSYELGLRGVKKDLQEALKWFKLAFENEHPGAEGRVESLKALITKEDSCKSVFDRNYFSFLDVTRSLVESKYKEPFLSLRRHKWAWTG